MIEESAQRRVIRIALRRTLDASFPDYFAGLVRNGFTPTEAVEVLEQEFNRIIRAAKGEAAVSEGNVRDGGPGGRP